MRTQEVLVLDEVEGPVYFIETPCGWARVTEVTPVQRPLDEVLTKLRRNVELAGE